MTSVGHFPESNGNLAAMVGGLNEPRVLFESAEDWAMPYLAESLYRAAQRQTMACRKAVPTWIEAHASYVTQLHNEIGE